MSNYGDNMVIRTRNSTWTSGLIGCLVIPFFGIGALALIVGLVASVWAYTQFEQTGVTTTATISGCYEQVIKGHHFIRIFYDYRAAGKTYGQVTTVSTPTCANYEKGTTITIQYISTSPGVSKLPTENVLVMTAMMGIGLILCCAILVFCARKMLLK